MDAWNDPNVSVMHSPKVTPTSPPKSFLDAVVVETHNTQPRVNFRSLIIDEHVENSDCVLPMEHTKFGFQSVMRDDDDVYYFKFTSMTGLEQVLEKGPWLIRNLPLILTKWSPNMSLSKDKVTKVPVWVKIHKVPVVAYSEDGLSIIATQTGKPIMLDAFTSAMCAEPYGRLGFARTLIEVMAEKELKSQVTMVVPMVNGEGHSMAKMDVVHKWKPSRCDECLVFGHANEQCPKRVIDTPKKLLLSKMMDSPLLLIGRTKARRMLLKRNMLELEENGENNNGIKLRNLFDKLNDISYQVDPNCDMGDVGITSDTTKPDEDSDSEVEESIYAGNKTIERRTLWADLDLHKYVVRDFPWVLMGDFNVALNIEDSYLGLTKMNLAMCDFKDCVKKIEVIDINSFGLHYTWNQKLKASNGVLKKLDRIMGNIGFVDNFLGAYAIFQPYRISNHSPAVLKLPSLSVEGHAMFQVTQKMKNVKKPLRKLLHDQGNLQDRVNRLRVELDVVQKALDSDPSNSLLRDEEVVYIQAIEVITNSANVVVTGNEVPDVFVAHYESFLVTNIDCTDLDTTWLFVKHVFEFSNANMVCQVSNDEIKRAMFDIGDGKSHGPDGYTSAFFKKGWDVVGSDVCRVVRNFFDNGKLLKELNNTFLALIPKVTTPMRVNDFRPISCYNVLFKCISKILTNRIIEGIKDVVSENQSDFVPGRRISDNILLTQELMHNYHLDHGQNRCAFKVDIQKAYDTVDWRFWVLSSRDLGFIIPWQTGFKAGRSSFSLLIYVGDANSDFDAPKMDDLFLFSRGDLDSAKVIMESLDEFKLVSGLVPSIPKSTVYFCNVTSHVKLAILNIMPFAEGILHVQYLGRLQLCKSVISSMQVYWASVLVIPMGIVRDIQQLIRGFLCCNGDYKRGKAKVGNGLNTSLWFDRWCIQGPLIWFLSPRDIAREGYTLKTCVADLITNGAWNWPISWLAKAPTISSIVVPLLRGHVDKVFWRSSNGSMSTFSVKLAWEALRPRGAEVGWCSVVWFSHCIPRHAFNLWLIMRRCLKTQDNLRSWDVGEIVIISPLRCSMCNLVMDSHEHLFFECVYSSNVWRFVRTFAGMESVSPRLEDIVDRLRPMAAKRTFKSIVGKLILAATAYFIWSERNNHLFKNVRRSLEELNDLIMVVVRLKLTTFRFKNKLEVMSMLAKWKLPNNFRIYGP
uniref:Reverse transcriptase domain-containing protein n=1 Tax=Tanacetum cinerariifolium TaxID=118510 RepID=A0A6L2J3Q0_TANCI|nr:hypothetical protein [Tanacetum cinerariifolium]